ncbi:MAG: fructose-1,6-bisphosphatase [Clostridia bacterium]
MKILKILSEKYPTIQSASTEIINLNAICCLPKGTEHFLSDLHGEKDAFSHIINNCSGVIREKIDMLFDKSLSHLERTELATLIYYPKEKLEEIKEKIIDINPWYKATLTRLIAVCRLVASKYTRSKVRKSLPPDFEWVLDELLHADHVGLNRELYYEEIVNTIVNLSRAESFIIALSTTIKTLAVDTLHIVGDIFDRGTHPDGIMDLLIAHHSCDVQWGNHDILWMGACSGSLAYIANVLNGSLTYNNTEALESSYGISLRPLLTFAKETYKNATCFQTKGDISDENELELALMRKAIAIIMFKLEGEIILRNPDFQMQDRLLLNKINYVDGTICLNDKTYKLKDFEFPTIDPADPYKLTVAEELLIRKFQIAFTHSEKLQKHINFLYNHGSMYLIYNNNLLYHGCVPMTDDGEFMTLEIGGKKLFGKALFDFCDKTARLSYYAKSGSDEKKFARDFMWYLWCGSVSPLFGKYRITTFERLLIDDPETHVEKKNAYYKLYNNFETFKKIAKEFNLSPNFSHIVNGHVPVKSLEGENPIKAGGRLIVIDGGFCKALQPQTGIAGYTLIFNSYGLKLLAHTPFESKEKAVKENVDIHSQVNVFDLAGRRITVAETDTGKKLRETIDDLTKLVQAYQSGVLKEH